MLDGNGNILSCRLEVPFVMRGENLNNNEIRNGLEGNKIKIGCRLQWEVKDKADFCCYTKVFADVASDALQHCKSRQAAPVKDKIEQPKDKRLVLTMDDLSKALQEVNKLKHFAFTSFSKVPSVRRPCWGGKSLVVFNHYIKEDDGGMELADNFSHNGVIIFETSVGASMLLEQFCIIHFSMHPLMKQWQANGEDQGTQLMVAISNILRSLW